MTRARILIVDDNPFNLKLARLLVASDGHEALTAADAYAALDVLAGGPNPDLILMDLQMPGIDGLELTRRLKADPATSEIPIVALTAAALECDERAAEEAGCDGFMRKPLDTRAFGEAILKHLERRRDAA